MSEVLKFCLIGLGLGAMYSLASQGLVLIYRGSGVLNFAQGAMGMLGAYAFWEMRFNLGLPFAVSLVLGVAVSMAVGALSHVLIMKRLTRASPLARVVATLGMLLTLESLAVLRYGGRATFVTPDLPMGEIEFTPGIGITYDRLIMLVVAALLTVALWVVYRYTRFGLGTNAVAENELAASTLGWSPDRIAIVNWGLGAGLAGLAAILVSPIVTLQVSVMTNLVLAAMAAALVAGFRSFPIAFVAGLALGVAQTVTGRYTADTPGLALSVPFLVIVVVLMVRGQALPLRDFLLQRLPLIGTGQVRRSYVVIGSGIAIVMILLFSARWVDALTITMGVGLILLSIVLLTGYAGQLSLAQFALAGFGALVAGRLVASWGVPFELASLAGVFSAIPLGFLFALPALRTRGITLAVVTLGLGASMDYMVFNNGSLTGGVNGMPVGRPSVFGIDVSAIAYPERYAFLTLLFLVLVTLGVANVRRGRSGRRLIAVRTNERAAAALGINVTTAKMYAFALAAGIAAAGGILLSFRYEQISFSTSFTNFESISAVGWAMIGGIGFLLGPIVGATLAPGSLGAALLDSIPGDIGRFLPLISGLLLILFVVQNQDGSAKELSLTARLIHSKFSRKAVTAEPQAHALEAADESEATPVRVAQHALIVEELSVRYGPTTAVDAVSFEVKPGRVLGLIGPNGAGKTSIIDAITGFTPNSHGTVRLDGVPLDSKSVVARARLGLSRSFQSLELFEDSTVLDNMQTAADPRDLFSYFRDFVWPLYPGLPAAAVAAIHEFGLKQDLAKNAQDLPYGRRRLLALARALASEPSILLLDEPAAGLGDVETAELANLVRRLAAQWGIGVLVVEHDMNFVMNVCDEVVVLDFGRKIAQGTPEEIREDPAVLKAYLGETDEELAEDEFASKGGIR